MKKKYIAIALIVIILAAAYISIRRINYFRESREIQYQSFLAIHEFNQLTMPALKQFVEFALEEGEELTSWEQPMEQEKYFDFITGRAYIREHNTDVVDASMTKDYEKLSSLVASFKSQVDFIYDGHDLTGTIDREELITKLHDTLEAIEGIFTEIKDDYPTLARAKNSERFNDLVDMYIQALEKWATE